MQTVHELGKKNDELLLSSKQIREELEEREAECARLQVLTTYTDKHLLTVASSCTD